MAKKDPVNLTHQMILSIIPGINFYVFYRIQKLRMLFLVYLAVYICATMLLVGSTFATLFLFGTEENFATYMGIIDSLDTTQSHFIVITITSLINLYLVRRWSKKWNAYLENPKDDPPTFDTFY